jgi:hypothetical protein
VVPTASTPSFFGSRKGDDVPVELRRVVLRHRVHAVDAPHHLELVPVGLAREIGADRPPRVAAVVTPEDALRGEIEPRMRVRTDDDRRVPVPAEPRIPDRGLRLDVDLLPGAPVVADEAAVLRFGVDDVRVLRIDDGREPVAAGRDVPVGVDDAVHRVRARRAADGVVVLRTAVHVVERRVVVERDLVELR